MKHATTVFELSKILKISPSTVSRALKDHPDIAPETKRRVLDLASKLDYEPNVFAVGLRTSKTKELGIIVPALNGFFYDSVITVVEEHARAEGYSLLILVSGDDPEVEKENLRICKQRRVDGVFVSVTSRTIDFTHFEKLQRQDVPVIFIDKVPQHETFHKICFEDEKAAALAANYLINKGKQKILSLFGNENMSITKRRLHSYKSVFNDLGLAGHCTYKFISTIENASKAVFTAFRQIKVPDAVFCMSDDILIGTMKAVQILKLQVPEQIGILSISNGMFPKYYHPEITYIETSGQKLGQLAFKRMMDCLNDNKERIELTVESTLIEGGSI